MCQDCLSVCGKQIKWQAPHPYPPMESLKLDKWPQSWAGQSKYLISSLYGNPAVSSIQFHCPCERSMARELAGWAPTCFRVMGHWIETDGGWRWQSCSFFRLKPESSGSQQQIHTRITGECQTTSNPNKKPTQNATLQPFPTPQF